MPGYRTHSRFNLLLLIPIDALLLQRYSPKDILLFSLGYIFATYYLSPDMDIFRSGPIRRWGILRFIWLPYSLFFTHRGISHIPIIGTLTRIGYLLILSIIISLIVFRDYRIVEEFAMRYRREIIWILLGMFASDTLHALLDKVATWFRRRKY